VADGDKYSQVSRCGAMVKKKTAQLAITGASVKIIECFDKG